MINKIFIKNYALIDLLSLDFNSGFTTITGETGAGKSIVLGAMGLALGNRADSSYLKDATQKCVIEIHVDISNFSLKKQFEKLDLDYDDHSILRREIQPSGKSRAFINDTPIKLSELQKIGKKLVDIHSQHDTLLLNDKNYQLNILDTLAKNQKEKARYSEKFAELKKLNAHLEKLLKKQDESEDVDYLRFLVEELDLAKIKPNEENQLEEKLNVLEHIGEIASALSEGIEVLKNEERGALESLRNVEIQLNKAVKYQDKYQALAERVHSARIDLEDVAFEIEQEESNLESDPETLEIMRQRFDQIMRLNQKHRVENSVELIAKHHLLNNELFEIENSETIIKKQNEKIAACKKELDVLAKNLHQTRLEIAPKIESKILALLKNLNFEGAQFKLNLSISENFKETGKDDLQFLFSANKGMPMQAISKVASGGELSRLMLSLKAVMAKADGLPTIIFDEIDSGVSGDTAKRMAQIIKDMSAHMQVWAITHLPQIAAAGNQQMVVEKTIVNQQTKTNLRPLNQEERVEAIAKMLSHSNPTKAALENARDLIAVS